MKNYGRKQYYISTHEITHQRTTEACDFRDNIQYFNDMKVKVYGISGDSRKTRKLY